MWPRSQVEEGRGRHTSSHLNFSNTGSVIMPYVMVTLEVDSEVLYCTVI